MYERTHRLRAIEAQHAISDEHSGRELTMLEGRVLYTQMVVDERRRQQRELAAADRSGKRFYRLARRPGQLNGSR